MSVQQTIPRNGLVWLLVAQVAVILPHLGHLPLWVIGLWLACATWRVQIFRMCARYPRSWLKVLMMIGVGGGVYLSRGSLIGLDAGVVLLIAAFILKLVEMRSRRDAWVLIFLGFFITRIVVPAYLMLGYWFVLQLLGGLPTLAEERGGVAFWAHAGGFIAGALLIKLFQDDILVARHRALARYA